MEDGEIGHGREPTGGRSESQWIGLADAFVVILFVLAVALSVAGYLLSGTLLGVLGTPESIMGQAQEYLQVTFLGILFLFGYNFISTVLRALGDSRTPMRFVLVAVVLNVVLDPLFIYVFGWGIRGAALATVVSQGTAFCYGLVYVMRRQLAPFRRPSLPGWSEVRTILNLGIPSGLQMAVISAGSAAIMSVVTGFGAAVVGGFGAAQRIDSLIMLPAQALGISVSSMAGQNIGSRNWDRVGRISRVGVAYNLAIMAAVALLVVLLARPAVSLFVREHEAVEFGANYLRVVALCYPFLGINFVLNGVVRASGAMYQVLALNFISFWVLRFPLTSLFAHWFGEAGIALGMGTSFIVSSAFAYLYYRFGRWREKELFAEDR